MIYGIYLAAGNSSRMGGPKLSLPLGNQCLGNYGLNAALKSTLDRVIVVSKEGDPLNWISSHSKKQHKFVHTVCKTASLGQSESLKHGLKLAQTFNIDAIVVMLADQPLITKEIVNELILRFRKSSHNYIAASSGRIVKPPALFNSTLFPALLQLKGDYGARHLLRTVPGLVIEYQNNENFLDIDTPADYEYVKNYLKTMKYND